jgi:uncharacterized membrane protein YfcA
VSFEPWQWTVLAAGAALVGLSKSGIPGIGILAVAVFQWIIPPKEATGLVLPLLIVGDIAAVATYREHTQWRHVVRLFPWTAAGVVLGYFVFRRIDNRAASILIGAILLVMLALHLWRKWTTGEARLEEEISAHGVWFAPVIGIGAGFTTLIANAAGPLMVLYLLAMGLPKMKFLGTSAVYFCVLNLFKVPFMAHLGAITVPSLEVNLWLAPAVLAGSWLGRVIAGRVSQRLFEWIALVLTFVSAVRMVLR